MCAPHLCMQEAASATWVGQGVCHPVCCLLARTARVCSQPGSHQLRLQFADNYKKRAGGGPLQENFQKRGFCFAGLRMRVIFAAKQASPTEPAASRAGLHQHNTYHMGEEHLLHVAVAGRLTCAL